MHKKKYLSRYEKLFFRMFLSLAAALFAAAVIISCAQAGDAVAGEGSLTVFVETESETEYFPPAVDETDADKIIVSIKDIIVVPENDEEDLLVILSYQDGEKQLDLLAFESVNEVIGTGTVPAGIYSQIRIVLHPENNYIKFEGDEEQYPLTIPSGPQTGIKYVLDKPVIIEEGSSWLMTINWDLTTSESINKIKSGAGYLMTPVIKVVFKQAE